MTIRVECIKNYSSYTKGENNGRYIFMKEKYLTGTKVRMRKRKKSIYAYSLIQTTLRMACSESSKTKY